MTFPASLSALGKVCQSTDGAQTEVITIPSSASGYHLGAGLSPAQPSTWINTPDGAYPILAPGAPTTGTGTGFSGGGLTASSAYTWALTNVTDYGETPAGAQLVVPNSGSFTGYILSLPAITAGENTTDNPLRRRRIYRTVAGGAQLKYAGEIADLSLTTWRDWLSDAELGDNAPTSNTSGVTGLVTISGGGVSVWTERAPTTAQASLASGDYVVNRTTGNIVFSTSDYARTSVTVAWTGETVATSSLVMSLINALRDTGGAIAAASGVPTLDANSHVVQQGATGVRQVKSQQVTADLALLTSMNAPDLTNVANWSDWLSGLNQTISTSGGTLRLAVSMTASCSTLASPAVAVGMRYSGPSSGFLNLGYVQSLAGSNVRGGIACGCEGFLSLAAGTYTFTPIWIAPSTGATPAASCQPSTRPTTDRASFSVEEVN